MHNKSVRNRKRIIGLASGISTPKILVAEDHDDNRDLLIRILKSSGLEVLGVKNGLEAVDICKSWEPDFIWMDIRMPLMGGLEATRIIRSNGFAKDIKIVALSAHVLDNKKEEILSAGFDDFVGKPFSSGNLFDVMARHLDIEFEYDS